MRKNDRNKRWDGTSRLGMQFSLSSKQFSFNVLYSYSLSIYFSRLSLLCPSVCLLSLLIGFTGVFQSLYTICTDQIRVINLFFFIPLPRVWSLQAPLLDHHKTHNRLLWDPAVPRNVKGCSFSCPLALIWIPLLSSLSLPTLQSPLIYIHVVSALVSTQERGHTVLFFLSLAYFINGMCSLIHFASNDRISLFFLPVFTYRDK